MRWSGRQLRQQRGHHHHTWLTNLAKPPDNLFGFFHTHFAKHLVDLVETSTLQRPLQSLRKRHENLPGGADLGVARVGGWNFDVYRCAWVDCMELDLFDPLASLFPFRVNLFGPLTDARIGLVDVVMKDFLSLVTMSRYPAKKKPVYISTIWDERGRILQVCVTA